MKRKQPDKRKAEIFAAAVYAAKVHGWREFTRVNVATVAGVSPSLVTAYWGSMEKLRNAVMKEAVRVEDLRILAAGILCSSPIAIKAPDELKRRAMEHILKVY